MQQKSEAPSRVSLYNFLDKRMFFDYIKIEKNFSDCKDMIHFSNFKLVKVYANGTQEFLVSNGFRPLQIIWNEKVKTLTVRGSFPFFLQGHNFCFSNQNFYDTIEILEYMIGVSLLDAEVLSFEYGIILKVERPSNEIFSKHLDLIGFKRKQFENGIYFEDKILIVKLYDAGQRLKTVCKTQFQSLRNDYGFDSKAIYIRLENHYKKPAIRFKQRFITVENLFNNIFQETLKQDLMNTYKAIKKSKPLRIPIEKKHLNTSTIPMLFLQELSVRYGFDVEAGLMEFLKAIPSQVLNKHDKSKRKRNLIENFEKLSSCKVEVLSHDLLPNLETAFINVNTDSRTIR